MHRSRQIGALSGESPPTMLHDMKRKPIDDLIEALVWNDGYDIAGDPGVHRPGTLDLASDAAISPGPRQADSKVRTRASKVTGIAIVAAARTGVRDCQPPDAAHTDRKPVLHR
jgi:hypothetical protein